MFKAIFGVSLLLLPGLAAGNIRAPRSMCRPGGGAPAGTAATNGNVIVLGEVLNVSCGKSKCTVVAEYEVEVKEASEQVYDFLAPFGELISVKLNDLAIASAEMTLTDKQWEKVLKDLAGCHHIREEVRGRLPIRQGRFAVAWTKGKHKLSVEYVQQMGFEEHGYGYFSDGEIEKTFAYELWPLRTWTLGPNFEIKVMVQSDRDAPSFFTALGGFERLSCAGIGKVEDGAFDRPNRVKLTGTFERNFPDRLICQIIDNGEEPVHEDPPM